MCYLYHCVNLLKNINGNTETLKFEIYFAVIIYRFLFLCSYKASVSCYSFSFLLCLNYIYAIVYNCIYTVILHRRRVTTETIETTTMTMMTMTPSSTETARSISDLTIFFPRLGIFFLTCSRVDKNLFVIYLMIE